MKIIIAGLRNFTEYDLLKTTINNLLAKSNTTITEVVSGGANGADKLGEQYAVEYNIPIKRFNADWNKYGNAAGPIRNKQMAEYSDRLIAFWDGKSRGTGSMIKLAKKNNLKTFVKQI
tara:strand:+ start:165 stop:518 length:354 start_codon:yes stop_codon:yes gene_type:complete